jgi:hypothetical protein
VGEWECQVILGRFHINVVNWDYKDIAIKMIVFELSGRFHINVVNWIIKILQLK